MNSTGHSSRPTRHSYQAFSFCSQRRSLRRTVLRVRIQPHLDSLVQGEVGVSVVERERGGNAAGKSRTTAKILFQVIVAHLFGESLDASRPNHRPHECLQLTHVRGSEVLRGSKSKSRPLRTQTNVGLAGTQMLGTASTRPASVRLGAAVSGTTLMAVAMLLWRTRRRDQAVYG